MIPTIPKGKWNIDVFVQVNRQAALIFFEFFCFVKALQKFKIAKKTSVLSGNKMKVDALQLTMETESADVRRVFQLMWEKAKSMKPTIVFDPLGLFED